MKKRTDLFTILLTQLLRIVMIAVIVLGLLSACGVPGGTGKNQPNSIDSTNTSGGGAEKPTVNIRATIIPSISVNTLTSTPVVTSTVKPTLIWTPVSSPTPLLKTYPDALAFTLDNGGCEFPCLLGVTLGKTPIKEYRKALEDQFDLSFITFEHKEKISHDATSLAYHGAKRIESAASLSLYYSDGSIKGLSIGGSLSALPYLSIKKILANRGIPDQVFVDYQIIAPGYGLPDEAALELVLYYQNPWLGVRYSSLAKKKEGEVYTFCSPDLSESNREDTSVFLMSQSFDKAYSDKELGEIFIGSTGSLPQGVNIQDALEISAADFYHRIMQEEAPCFQTKIQFWEDFFNGGVK